MSHRFSHRGSRYAQLRQEVVEHAGHEQVKGASRKPIIWVHSMRGFDFEEVGIDLGEFSDELLDSSIVVWTAARITLGAGFLR